MSNFDLSNYKTVPERIAEARAKYPMGSFQTELLVLPPGLADKYVAVKARFFRDATDPRPGEGVAWEVVPGKTPYTKDSELQNCETSAWGRALVAAFAVDASKGIASREEVEARQPSRQPSRPKRTDVAPSHKTVPVTDENMDGAKWANRQKLLLLEALGDKESAKQAWVEVLEKLSLTPDDEIPEDAHGSIEAELDLLLAEAVIEEQLPL